MTLETGDRPNSSAGVTQGLTPNLVILAWIALQEFGNID